MFAFLWIYFITKKRHMGRPLRMTKNLVYYIFAFGKAFIKLSKKTEGLPFKYAVKQKLTFYNSIKILLLMFLLFHTHCSFYSQRDPLCSQRQGRKQNKTFSLSQEEREKAFAEFASKERSVSPHKTPFKSSHKETSQK